ncbi:hypothetical protein Q3G72_035456 [Acer saccharum]|nr:hypothetical protein Q3G72_035456 [Acer saccharum]
MLLRDVRAKTEEFGGQNRVLGDRRSKKHLRRCSFSYNDFSGPLPHIPLFQNMAINSFIGNKGLGGGPLGNCGENPSSGSVPPLKSVTTSRGRIITTVAAAVGDLVEAINYFHERYAIGSEASGTVYKAVMDSGLTATVKKPASNKEGNTIENSFRAKILTLGKIRHHNIVKMYG